MEYPETGRIGRITKNLRKHGFEDRMESILFDAHSFSTLKKKEQTKYIETVLNRMTALIGRESTDAVMHSCGEQCCGKSWSSFARNIRNKSDGTIADFIRRLNIEEEKYNTFMEYHPGENLIKVFRTACICGMVNKGDKFSGENRFCSCSIGHMSVFFGAVFRDPSITFKASIMNGNEQCEWHIILPEVNTNGEMRV